MGLLEDILAQQTEILKELAALRTQKTADVYPEGFVGIEVAMEMLKVGRDCVRRKCQQRIIPFYQEGTSSPQLFKRSELIAYIESKRKATAEESAKGTLKKVHARRN